MWWSVLPVFVLGPDADENKEKLSKLGGNEKIMCLGKKMAYTVLGQKNQISFILQQEEERPRKAADLERVTCINQYNYMETWTATALESECSLSCIPREVA